MSLTKKIDFALILKVTNANPNGDPLNGNRPRADFQGFGEMTDVCLKRKIRDRLQDSGESIFVQSDEKKTDGMTSLANRAKDKDVGLGADAFNAKKANKDDTAKKACEKWLDVRSFGQVFAFSGDGSSGISIAVRGPVTIQSAFSVEPINITSTQITKSVSGEGDGTKKKLRHHGHETPRRSWRVHCLWGDVAAACRAHRLFRRRCRKNQSRTYQTL